MCVHGSQAVHCATELCLPVDKLKEEKKTGKERCWCIEVNDNVVYILAVVKTENTHTPARLEALFESSQSLPFLSHPRSYHSYHPGEAQISSQTTMFAIHPDVSQDLQCSLCSLDSQRNVSLVSTVVLPSSHFNVFESAWYPAL